MHVGEVGVAALGVLCSVAGRQCWCRCSVDVRAALGGSGALGIPRLVLVLAQQCAWHAMQPSRAANSSWWLEDCPAQCPVAQRNSLLPDAAADWTLPCCRTHLAGEQPAQLVRRQRCWLLAGVHAARGEQRGQRRHPLLRHARARCGPERLLLIAQQRWCLPAALLRASRRQQVLPQGISPAARRACVSRLLSELLAARQEAVAGCRGRC